MFRIIWSSLVLLLALACSDAPETTEEAPQEEPQINRWADSELRKIYTLQDERKTAELLNYLNHENSEYREMAALAFASILDSTVIEPLATLLTDTVVDVRYAAAYSLGQIKNNTAEALLRDAFAKEKSEIVRSAVLEAVGKCGTADGLEWLAGLQFNNHESITCTGQAFGIYRFSLQKLVSETGTAKMVELLGVSSAQFAAASYLSRTRDIDLSAYSKEIIGWSSPAETHVDDETRWNLIRAMGKVKTPEIPALLDTIMRSNLDHRIRINAIHAASGHSYKTMKEAVISCLTDSNPNVAVHASEYFLQNGSRADAKHYPELAKSITNWRARANMLAAAFKHGWVKAAYWGTMENGYKNASNIYEKAWMLRAMTGNIYAHEFIAKETFGADNVVLSTYGMEALVEIRKNKQFDIYSKKGSEDLYPIFARYFKKAIESGDVAMVGLAAGALRDPKLNYKQAFSNYDFLKKTLEKFELPREIEGYLEVKKTINFFEGREPTDPMPEIMNNPIDWELVKTIPHDQKVLIKTTKGDITIELFVDEAPGSVANFIKLIRQDFYKTSVIHRVVPNFVIQDGCPRGDGWGGPDFSIRSEYGPLYYKEGTLGMASAGPDTESGQWFITHSATPHLDGRYSIFGQVVKGMDVVNTIEVGDRLLGFEIL